MQDVKVDREKYIGGSDIPTIMGISKFSSRYDLLLFKAGLKEGNFEGNEYTEYGNTMEPKIRQYINTLFSRNFKEDKLIKDDIRCHFDGIDDEMVLEIKTTSHIYERVSDYTTYLVQLLFYMMNSNRETGMLCVYERPNNFDESFDSDRLQIFTITLSQYKTLCEEINEAVEQFRIDLQKIKDNPFLTEQDLIDTGIVSIANIVVKLEKQLNDYDKLKAEYEDFKLKLKEAMQKNNLKTWEMNGGTRITLVDDTPSKIVKKFNESKFKEENELLYNKYLEDKEQKGKAGYIRITLKGGNDE